VGEICDDYHVGWICALPIEYVAAIELLDDHLNGPSGIPSADDNIYRFGRMGHHNIVIACMPKGKYGTTSAASTAKDMMRSFTKVQLVLMVGIGGGAPSRKHDIRLGDVVVGVPANRHGGVVHYEFGKSTQNHGFKRTGQLNSPPTRVLTALQDLDAIHRTGRRPIALAIPQIIRDNPRLNSYARPDPQTDVLFDSSFIHPDDARDCMESCISQTKNVVQRVDRDKEADSPVVHYGLIASADRLMKHAYIRDFLAESEGVMCFEMEAAGLMDRFPCLVIRGICDYSDTHKNNRWQGYAAATAAAYAKELLGVIPAY
jgi:nucleoside phosphorylase